jgi:alkaline phosphatase
MKTRTLTLLLVAALMGVIAPLEATAKNKVKNIILMVGDGMGVAQVSYYMIENRYEPINMQRAQHGGLITTYSANNRVTDSAASATTYATRHKTKNARLSVDPQGNPVTTILEKAEAKGLATGVVATCYITHATPAAFYAHAKSRNDNDTISVQLINSGIDVAFGGGDAYFTKRKDGRNLLEGAKQKGYSVVDNIEALDGVSSGNHLCIYPTGKNHMKGKVDGRDDYLPTATAKALEILSNNSKKGFFAMIEGSLIDYGGHGRNAKVTLEEVRDFDKAVGVAMDFADKNPGTLVIVLADHETGGLSIVSNNQDFTTSESGIECRFSTGGHSGSMVPLFTYGTCADKIGGILDNTEINTKMCELLGL